MFLFVPFMETFYQFLLIWENWKVLKTKIQFGNSNKSLTSSTTIFKIAIESLW